MVRFVFMSSRRLLTLMAGLLFAACTQGGPGPYNETPSLGATKAFSATVGAVPVSKAIYGDRYGPSVSPWSDSFVDVVAPPAPGALQNTKVASLLGGPEVLVGSLAVSVGLLGTASETVTVATDLDTGAEKWRLAAAESFEKGLVTTDGTVLCGLRPATLAGAIAQCATLATGAILWAKPVGRVVSLVQGYGWPAEVRIHGDALFVLGQGKLDVFALADGTVRFSLDQRHIGQGLVFVGADLVLSGAASGCASGTSCLRAVSPTTGATVAESATLSASFLWATNSTAFYLASPAGGARAIVTYDASTHTFGDDAALLTALADVIGTNPRQTLFGLTPVLANGKVYLGGGDASWLDDPLVPGKLCRFSVKTRTKDGCVDRSSRPNSIRVHPNFVPGGGATLLPDTGTSNVTTPALYFGRWAFIGGEVHGIH